MSDYKPSNLHKADVIAQLFGISVRRVQQLTQEGVIQTVRDPNGGCRKYELVSTIQSYVKYLSDKAYGREQTIDNAKLKDSKLQAEIALKESQAELHHLKTEIAKGEYISKEDVKIDYQRFFVVFKKMAMAIPSRIGGVMAGYVEPVIVRGVEKDLKLEIDNILRTFIVAGVSGDAN